MPKIPKYVAGFALGMVLMIWVAVVVIGYDRLMPVTTFIEASPSKKVYVVGEPVIVHFVVERHRACRVDIRRQLRVNGIWSALDTLNAADAKIGSDRYSVDMKLGKLAPGDYLYRAIAHYNCGFGERGAEEPVDVPFTVKGD